ncbi:MAG: hypothetical protein JMDDDDMK_00687 [Acidobacteria bacterium]|nr:hypothetical protein [Acidobacteriota bacterium]
MFAESPGRQHYDLVPSRVVHQRFQHLIAFALPDIAQHDGCEILLESQMQEAVKPAPFLIQSAFEKNAAEFSDVAAKLRRPRVGFSFGPTRVEDTHRFYQQLVQFLFADQAAGSRAVHPPGDGGQQISNRLPRVPRFGDDAAFAHPLINERFGGELIELDTLFRQGRLAPVNQGNDGQQKRIGRQSFDRIGACDGFDQFLRLLRFVQRAVPAFDEPVDLFLVEGVDGELLELRIQLGFAITDDARSDDDGAVGEFACELSDTAGDLAALRCVNNLVQPIEQKQRAPAFHLIFQQFVGQWHLQQLTTARRELGDISVGVVLQILRVHTDANING